MNHPANAGFVLQLEYLVYEDRIIFGETLLKASQYNQVRHSNNSYCVVIRACLYASSHSHFIHNEYLLYAGPRTHSF